jgi:two-component system autoinducer 1 sensor kinase/phosphatase LuxN
LGYRVLTASRPKAGLQLAATNAIDAVVVDYEMPEMNGCEVASILKRSQPTLPILMFSGSGSIPERARNVIDGFFDKAGSRVELQAAIQQVLDHSPIPRSATPVYAA